MNGFWPSIPFYIPYSPGMPNWWDLVWWIFQLVIMSALLLILHLVATREDQVGNDESKSDPS
ncbi:hypothetical protein [Sulfoacidibacillus thermotolerans]|uniref:Uncharacterized protein n=1 Tax=Sulfoacidibacillus thermotolerans TaxID=1765684 RepID=A0A2U3D961_SULT2|nr:hypothetical protein [Sulfoacidibacillus thermotolerans]PWI57816.1 hypothetical protein BM613_06385 [Sulfoacidibacillus thermotolerans]